MAYYSEHAQQLKRDLAAEVPTDELRVLHAKRPLLHALHERGHPIVLPETPKRGNPLIFRLWRPGDVLVAERFGTMRPDGEVKSLIQ